MYVVEDRVTPAVSAYAHAARIRNVFLRHWPTTGVGANKVFTKLYMYNGSVLRSLAHEKIYWLMNTSYAELEKQKYDGIEKVWLYLKYIDTNMSITKEQLQSWTNLAVPIDTEYTTTVKFLTDTFNTSHALDTDAELVELIRTKPFYCTYDTIKNEKFLSMALLDIDGVLFEKSIKILKKTLVQVTSESEYSNISSNIPGSDYSVNGIAEIKYKRIVDAYTPDAYFDSLIARLLAMPNWDGAQVVSDENTLSSKKLTEVTLETTLTSPINAQLYDIYTDVVPLTDTELYTSSGELKYDGIAALPVKEFTNLLPKIIATDYDEEDAEWWETLLVVVLTIVIMVAAYLTGQWWALGNTGLVAAAMFATAAAVVLTVGMMGMGLLAKAAASKGMYGAANQIGTSVKILGYISTVMGIIATITGIGATISAAKTAANEAIKKGLTQEAQAYAREATTMEVAKQMAKDFVTRTTMSTSQMLTQGLSIVSKAFQYYTENVAPANAGLAERQALVAEQEQQIEDTAGPDLVDKINYMYSDPYNNIFEFNSYMEFIPYKMTQGKIDDSFTKYYS